jgi:TolA-binding protein
MLVIRLSRALAKSARFTEALEALELVGGSRGDVKSENTPEYLYFMADMLNETGRRDEARATANKILKDFPTNIFAQKARILLTRIMVN